MKFLSLLALAGALCVVAPRSTSAEGQSTYRQYYSGWIKHPTNNYFYRCYYYKPDESYVGFKHHYVIYYPSQPKYEYFYNPYKKLFWGRCPSEFHGVPEYSLLVEADRRPDIRQIPEQAFPQPGAMPAIPESKDGVKVDLPPDDLPNDTPAAAAITALNPGAPGTPGTTPGIPTPGVPTNPGVNPGPGNPGVNPGINPGNPGVPNNPNNPGFPTVPGGTGTNPGINPTPGVPSPR